MIRYQPLRGCQRKWQAMQWVSTRFERAPMAVPQPISLQEKGFSHSGPGNGP